MSARTLAAITPLWHEAGLPASALDRLTLTGEEPVMPSSFAVGTAAQATIAMAALAATLVGELRGSGGQDVSVDMLAAVKGGLPHDELYCSYDKVARCEEIGIDLLIDDSPENLRRAIDAGITVATLEHPWNRELCETEDVICGKDWDELARNLEPVLSA